MVIVAAWFTDIISNTPPPLCFQQLIPDPLTASISCFKLWVITYLILIPYLILHHSTVQKGNRTNLKEVPVRFVSLLLSLHWGHCTQYSFTYVLCMSTLLVFCWGESLPVRNWFTTCTTCEWSPADICECQLQNVLVKASQTWSNDSGVLAQCSLWEVKPNCL